MAAPNARDRHRYATKGGIAVMAAMTPRQRKLRARKAARIRWERERIRKQLLAEMAS